MTEVLGRISGRRMLSPVRSGVPTNGVFTWRKRCLGKLVLVRVLVMFREQPGEELGV